MAFHVGEGPILQPSLHVLSFLSLLSSQYEVNDCCECFQFLSYNNPDGLFDYVVNIGRMKIVGLDFDAEAKEQQGL